MKSDIKLLWLAALRSGEYNQGKQTLHRPATETNPENFCCLGVLCDIHRKQTNNNWQLHERNDRNYYLSAVEVLPGEVMQWAGFSDSDPMLTIDDHHSRASVHNDGCYDVKTKSFSVIADAIEAQL